ncbi:hypothetical protein [Olivibacter domesticus]|nr:hypothetical protein [Olivibacter domesticus]
MSRDKKTPKSTEKKTASDYQSGKNASTKAEIISTGKPATKKGK